MKVTIARAEELLKGLLNARPTFSTCGVAEPNSDVRQDVARINESIISAVSRHKEIAMACCKLSILLKSDGIEERTIVVRNLDGYLMSLSRVLVAINDKDAILDAEEVVDEMKRRVGQTNIFFGVTRDVVEDVAMVRRSTTEEVALLREEIRGLKETELVELPEDVIAVLVEEKLLTT